MENEVGPFDGDTSFRYPPPKWNQPDDAFEGITVRELASDLVDVTCELTELKIRYEQIPWRAIATLVARMSTYGQPDGEAERAVWLWMMANRPPEGE